MWLCYSVTIYAENYLWNISFSPHKWNENFSSVATIYRTPIVYMGSEKKNSQVAEKASRKYSHSLDSFL